MNEHPATLRDLVDGLPGPARYHLEWLANWLAAWCYAEWRGWTDDIGTHEYWLLADMAWRAGVPPSQTAMRLWIRDQVAPVPEPKKGGNDHDQASQTKPAPRSPLP